VACISPLLSRAKTFPSQAELAGDPRRARNETPCSTGAVGYRVCSVTGPGNYANYSLSLSLSLSFSDPGSSYFGRFPPMLIALSLNANANSFLSSESPALVISSPSFRRVFFSLVRSDVVTLKTAPFSLRLFLSSPLLSFPPSVELFLERAVYDEWKCLSRSLFLELFLRRLHRSTYTRDRRAGKQGR